MFDKVGLYLWRICGGYRHGQSEYNVVGRIGGNSGLSDHGIKYAKKLAQFVENEVSAIHEDYAAAADEIEEQYPQEFELRKHDKLAYRYPRGESYLDVIARLEPIIIEMERHREPLLIIGHQGILRIIYAFYTGLKRADAPYVSIPLNTVIKMVPTAHGVTVDVSVILTHSFIMMYIVAYILP
ncbi:FKFBP [Symbiodinium microadriaticum]|nr:FKFBP [Symbiodinium microadriaticum]